MLLFHPPYSCAYILAFGGRLPLACLLSTSEALSVFYLLLPVGWGLGEGEGVGPHEECHKISLWWELLCFLVCVFNT